jgi:hypothetical protein
MLKIIAVKNECMHKLGAGLVQKYDNDIRLLERSLNEENNKISAIKKSLIRTSDIDGSNVVYKNSLKLHATQPLRDDTQSKIREYLKDHLTNFKPPNCNSQNLIEEIKAQNSHIIKNNGKSTELEYEMKPAVLKTHEIIEEQTKQRNNKMIKEKLNLTILPNLSPDTKIFMNLDVQYDFIPSNEEYLRKMRLDFITKKDKIVNFVRKNLTIKSHKQLFIKNSFQNDYQEWLKRTDSELHGGGSSRKVERFDIWNNRKKRKSVDETGYEREAELFKQNESDIPEAKFNHYSRQFFYHKKALNKIEDLVMYDLRYKENDLWSMDDVKLFITQYLSYPKDFETISGFFYNKTTRDIINFYFNFKHHFQLQKLAGEVYGPNYIRKHISKKIEFINEVADKL